MSENRKHFPNTYKDYFEEIISDNSSSTSYKIKCKLSPCKDSAVNKLFAVSTNSTSNIRRHLRVNNYSFLGRIIVQLNLNCVLYRISIMKYWTMIIIIIAVQQIGKIM